MRFAKSLLPLCAALLIFVAAIAAIHLAFANAPQPRTAKSVMLMYVGAKNCAPCDAWQRGEGAVFRTTPEYSGLFYTEVKSASLRDVLDDVNWPEDLRAYRGLIDRNAGVPLWMVIADGQLVHQDFGLLQWRRTVLPAIVNLLHSAK